MMREDVPHSKEASPLRKHFVKLSLALTALLGLQAWSATVFRTEAAGPPKLPNLGRGGQQHLNATHQEVELQVEDNVLVRRYFPPDQYDEKGKVRRPTSTELSELKGDPKLRGYKADVTDIRNGKIVEVRLLKKPDDSKSTKDKDKEDTNSKAAAPASTSTYTKPTAAPTLTGTVISYKSSDKKLVLRVDSATMGRHYRTSNTGKKTTLSDYTVDQVMIMSKDAPASDQPDKKKKQ
jgi:hypothetical protein